MGEVMTRDLYIVTRRMLRRLIKCDFKAFDGIPLDGSYVAKIKQTVEYEPDLLAGHYDGRMMRLAAGQRVYGYVNNIEQIQENLTSVSYFAIMNYASKQKGAV